MKKYACISGFFDGENWGTLGERILDDYDSEHQRRFSVDSMG